MFHYLKLKKIISVIFDLTIVIVSLAVGFYFTFTTVIPEKDRQLVLISDVMPESKTPGKNVLTSTTVTAFNFEMQK